MERGGKRPNSGRPKGSLASHTIQAQALKQRLVKRVLEEQEPIIEALIKQAKEGQIQALKEVFERVLGKVINTNVEIESGIHNSQNPLSDEDKAKLDLLLYGA